ncbi:MAG: type II toxin-antitoxin system HicA family toxin [Nitrospinae bacterium]|nr:type II toxin-antitoxin system HicA family toxin [Nitrospinota bacterium]
MKRRDLERALKAMGYTHIGGSKHERWVNKSGSYTAAVPRHKEIEEGLAKGILKQAAHFEEK